MSGNRRRLFYETNPIMENKLANQGLPYLKIDAFQIALDLER